MINNSDVSLGPVFVNSDNLMSSNYMRRICVIYLCRLQIFK